MWGMVVCKRRKFECLGTFEELFETMRNNPDMAGIWMKRHPCLLFCKKFAELTSVLQAVQELEEMEQMRKMQPYLTIP